MKIEINEHVPSSLSSSELEQKFLQANEHRDFSVYKWLMNAAEDAKAQAMFSYFKVKDKAVIVDKGSGTGRLAERAALEFSQNHCIVYAQDISHELLDEAEHGRSLIKLKYGDVRFRQFPENSVDIIYSSTCGHEVETFGGKGSMQQMVETSFAELKPGGQFVLRDMAKSTLVGDVYMQILSQEGFVNIPGETKPEDINYSKLSTRALFDRFYQEFEGGKAFNYSIETLNGQEYIKLDANYAQEFYLRKDYTGNWRNEIKETYTYWTPEEAKKVFEEKGFVHVQAIPEWNKYIIDKRLKGKIALYQLQGNQLKPVDFPPTHMVIVGEKPEQVGKVNEFIEDINYNTLLNSISVKESDKRIAIGEHEFKIRGAGIIGTKKRIFDLADEPYVLKIPRSDTVNNHNIFKSFYQIVERQKILDEYNIPHLRITDYDHQGPPYRYVVQEKAPQGSIHAAKLIETGQLTEMDIMQMAEIVNIFEKGKRWQLDTNPYSWFRISKPDDTTQMVYVSGKVYPYDESWEFRRVGLLQWLDASYVRSAQNYSAAIPLAKNYEHAAVWFGDDWPGVAWWKKYLDKNLQPQ